MCVEDDVMLGLEMLLGEGHPDLIPISMPQYLITTLVGEGPRFHLNLNLNLNLHTPNLNIWWQYRLRSMTFHLDPNLDPISIPWKVNIEWQYELRSKACPPNLNPLNFNNILHLEYNALYSCWRGVLRPIAIMLVFEAGDKRRVVKVSHLIQYCHPISSYQS